MPFPFSLGKAGHAAADLGWGAPQVASRVVLILSTRPQPQGPDVHAAHTPLICHRPSVLQSTAPSLGNSEGEHER